jgi:hypothetical protein
MNGHRLRAVLFLLKERAVFGQMANEQNLKRGGITAETASSMGKKGAAKSAESKRQKKQLKACLELLLEQKMAYELPDGKTKKMSGADAMAVRLFQQFMATGDHRIFETIRDTVGQKPADRVITAEVIDPSVMDEVAAFLERLDDGSDEAGGT